jgi:hypothetical protein
MIQGIRCNPKTLEVERDGVVIKLTTRAMLLFEGLLWLGPLDGLNKREAAVRLLGRDWSKARFEAKFNVNPMREIGQVGRPARAGAHRGPVLVPLDPAGARGVKLSLDGQISTLELLDRPRVRAAICKELGLKASGVDLLAIQLGAVLDTLRWLKANEAAIKAKVGGGQ